MIYFWLAGLTCLVGAGLCLAYVLVGMNKAARAMRLFEGVVLGVLAMNYLLAATGLGIQVMLVKTGVVAAWGITLLALLFIMEIIAGWRRC